MRGYKYRAVNKYSLDILESNNIYFSRYTDFNDPFEFSTPFPNVVNMFARVSEKIDFLHKTDIFDATSYKHLKTVCENIIKNGSATLETTHKSIREKLEKVGICSLSKVNDEILMWSHYADNHKGFCIGFDDLHKNTKPHTKPLPINYKTNFTDLDDPELIINFYTDIFHKFKDLPKAAWESKRANLARKMTFEDDQRGGISILTDKYKKWEYEQEFRLIDERYFGLKEFNPSCLKSITFGLRANIEDRENVIETCKKNKKMNVEFFQATKAHGAFKLEIIKI
ncbi:DUF2971 domain-containing protein [Pseudomonas yamanorum]|uniref:DUF2971 domain-containing protein n=1 Tax=Pseudomonas yamanorum TaxID=515393 RepID=A0A7Y8EH88_9PSED|nr:DUF2971 domain-containing protein [Pseudomonas yamanorum]NWE14661.1 DUF2971 domain-containing protein [Pseudomonas yamanorum]